MRSPWAALRGLFARVGSDPYYASYDRSLGNIKAEVDRLQSARAARAKAWAAIRARFLGGFASAWVVLLAYAAYVNRQPHGTYSMGQQAARVAPAFAAPLAGWLAYRLLGWLQALLDRRAAARVKQLEGKLRKQVAELKDSTRYERTLALLQKYDPDYAPPRPPPRTPSARAPGAPVAAQPAPGGGLSARAAGAAASMAGSALQGAGAFMLPALGQLYSRAASTLIADDPVTLALLQQAQQQEAVMGQRLKAAEGQAVALLQENIALKQRVGLPTEEEQAALAAWTAQAAGAPAAAGAGGAGNGGEAAAEGGAQGAAASPPAAAPAPAVEGGDAAATPAEHAQDEEEERPAATAGTPEPAGARGEGEAAGGSGSAGRVTRRRRGGASS